LFGREVFSEQFQPLEHLGVLLHGPTDTRHFNPADDPENSKKSE
jgi:hypothetical protein